MAGTFLLRNARRSAYAVSALTIEGVPDTQIAGDVAADATLTVSITCTEDLSGDLRHYLTDTPDFWGEVEHGEYGISWRDARLIGALPDRDYARHSLTFAFTVVRGNVLRLQRPMGRQPIDYEAIKQAQKYALSLDADVLRRRRMELDSASAALQEYSASLATAEAELEERRKQLDDAAAA